MWMEYLTDEAPEIAAALDSIEEAVQLLHSIQSQTPAAAGREHYLSGAEVCRFLHISTRTLQNLRDKRLIPYTTIGSKSIVYPESQILQLLRKNYRPAIDE